MKGLSSTPLRLASTHNARPLARQTTHTHPSHRASSSSRAPSKPSTRGRTTPHHHHRRPPPRSSSSSSARQARRGSSRPRRGARDPPRRAPLLQVPTQPAEPPRAHDPSNDGASLSSFRAALFPHRHPLSRFARARRRASTATTVPCARLLLPPTADRAPGQRRRARGAASHSLSTHPHPAATLTPLAPPAPPPPPLTQPQATHVLFESASGYALFDVRALDEIATSADKVQESIR